MRKTSNLTIALCFMLLIFKISHLYAQSIPKQNLIDIKGNTLNQADLMGKVVVVNYWFIGCQPCMIELPKLNEIYDDYKNKVVFLAISKDNDADQLSYFVKKFPFKYIQILPNVEWAKELNIRLFPTNLVYSKEGKLVLRIEGLNVDTIDSLRKAIDKCINEKFKIDN